MPIFTIGHSNHDWRTFIALLGAHGISAVADVRSSPGSQRLPQFSGESLSTELKAIGLAYVFLGDLLGGRPPPSMLTLDGHADYVRMAKTEQFCLGMERLLRGSERYRLALMCAEADPGECHRALMIGRVLLDGGIDVAHILRDETLESHRALEERLLREEGLAHDDMFAPRDARLAEAYRRRSGRFAWRPEREEVAAV